MQTSVRDRFLRYVRYDTQSREGAETYPSTPGQLVLLRDLVAELQSLGASDAGMDEHGYVMATIPATIARPPMPSSPASAAGGEGEASSSSRITRESGSNLTALCFAGQ